MTNTSYTIKPGFRLTGEWARRRKGSGPLHAVTEFGVALCDYAQDRDDAPALVGRRVRSSAPPLGACVVCAVFFERRLAVFGKIDDLSFGGRQ